MNTTTVTKWLSARRKAITALVVPLAVFALTKWGFDMDDGMVAALTTILTGGTVYAIPNGDTKSLGNDLPSTDRGDISVMMVVVILIGICAVVWLVRNV